MQNTYFPMPLLSLIVSMLYVIALGPLRTYESEYKRSCYQSNENISSEAANYCLLIWKSLSLRLRQLSKECFSLTEIFVKLTCSRKLFISLWLQQAALKPSRSFWNSGFMQRLLIFPNSAHVFLFLKIENPTFSMLLTVLTPMVLPKVAIIKSKFSNALPLATVPFTTSVLVSF